jgi:hypothetical protein
MTQTASEAVSRLMEEHGGKSSPRVSQGVEGG